MGALKKPINLEVTNLIQFVHRSSGLTNNFTVNSIPTRRNVLLTLDFYFLSNSLELIKKNLHIVVKSEEKKYDGKYSG